MQKEGKKYNIYPLSSEQKRMWYLYKIERRNPYYNVLFKINFNKEISSAVIKKALTKMIKRNSILRTMIIEIEEYVYQSIASHVEIPLEYEKCNVSEWKDIYNKAVLEEKNKPFDLENEIPIRFRLYELSDNKKELIIVIHHMFTDGWSMGLFRKELQKICMNYLLDEDREEKVIDKKYSYIDYVNWQQKKDMTNELDYWMKRLNNANMFTKLPTDFRRPKEEVFDGKNLKKVFTEAESNEVRNFAKANKVSVYTFFLSCFYLALSKMCNQNKLTVGTPVLNRVEETFHNVMGCFANTIVLSQNISESRTFLELLKNVNVMVLEGMEYQSLPFEILVEKIGVKREKNINPIFQVMFNMENDKLFGNEKYDDCVGQIDIPNINSKVQFDLICGILEKSGEYSIGFAYKTCLFSEETMLKALDLYKKIVKHYIKESEDFLTLNFAEAESYIFSSYEEKVRDKISNILQEEDSLFVNKVVYYNNKYFIYYCNNKNITADKLMEKIKEYTELEVVFVRLIDFIYDELGEIDETILINQSKKLDNKVEKYKDEDILNNCDYYEFEHDVYEREYINEDVLIKDNKKDMEIKKQDEKYSLLSGGELSEIEHKTLADLLLNVEEKFLGKKIYTIQYGGKESIFTYEELIKSAKIIASNLRKQGVQEGSFIVLQIEKLEEFIKTFWGCVLAGAVVIPLGLPQNLKYRDDEAATKKLLYVCEILTNAFLVCGEKVKKELDKFNTKVKIKEIIETEELLTDNRENFMKASIGENDIAMLLFTSGSTGMPKGVKLSHRNIVKRSQTTCKRYDFNEEEISLNWMPLDHVGGIVMFHILDIYNRSDQVQVETNEILRNPINWLLLLDKYQVTITWAPNFAYGLILEERKLVEALKISLKNCKFILNGGEAINYSACQEFMDLLARFKLSKNAMHPSWGMTETSSGILFSDRFGQVLYKNSVAVGTPSDGVKAKIIDENGAIVQVGRIGKLLVAGETINQGYYKNEEENKKCFPGDGWFDTGDLAIIKDGEIVITGRNKDIFIVNGVNISCLEVEKEIEQIDGIMSGGVACCPIKNEATNKDKVVIFYSITEGSEERQQEIHKNIQERLSENFGVYVDEFVPIEEKNMPRTSIGKIEKKKLENLYYSGNFKIVYASGQGGIINSFYNVNLQRQKLIYSNKIEIGTTVFVGSENNIKELKEIVQESKALEKVLFIELDNQKNNLNTKLKQVLISTSGKINMVLLECEEACSILSFITNAVSNSSLNRVKLLVLGEKKVNYSLIKGYMPAISVENPNIFGKLCIINNKNDLKLIINELNDVYWNFKNFIYVEIINGVRYVEQLNRINLNKSNINLEKINEKTYVMLGGLGGIGFLLSKYLLRDHKCRLILIGRKNHDEISQKLDILRKLGDVKYYKADLENKGNTKKALNDIEHLYGTFDGIINLIGDKKALEHWNNIDAYLSKNQTSETIFKGINTRVQVMHEIDDYLINKDGLEVIALSSVTALFGGNSFGAYSAASSYLLDYKLKNPNNKYKVIASSKWKNIGMSENESEDNVEVAKQLGYDVFDEKSGIKSIILMMLINDNKIIAGVNDLNYELGRFISVGEQFSALKLKENNKNKELNMNGNCQVENKMKNIWKNVLKLDDISLDAKFFEAGGNSLKSIYLISKINEEFETEISIVDLFQYPTIRQLSRKVEVFTVNESDVEDDDIKMIEI
ncbi:SDR family NAD(P)-dependent oxidoreductase [Clostridium beijerinckii]|uniref:SDR family NAD(P)-dependent oxidoreductase n=1 Tax=Clostridium beijerinckii TaxID=1520 RepID=UPI0030FE0179